MKKSSLTLACALTALAAPVAFAGMVSTTSAGTPILTVINPKTALVPQPTSCTNNPGGGPPTAGQSPVETQSATLTAGKVSGLPGAAGADLTGYATVPVRTRTANITINSVVIGTVQDRVYCKGSVVNGAPVCSTTDLNHVLAMRVNLNTNQWKPGVTQSFEVNNYFRAIKNTAVADIGYFMGTVIGGTDPNTAAARKYLEYAGRTFKGLNQITPPGNVAADRNNAWMMFWQDSNANDPERCEPHNFNSAWSPWFFVQQSCAVSTRTQAQAGTAFKMKLWQGGEEGQLAQNIQMNGYVCN